MYHQLNIVISCKNIILYMIYISYSINVITWAILLFKKEKAIKVMNQRMSLPDDIEIENISKRIAVEDLFKLPTKEERKINNS